MIEGEEIAARDILVQRDSLEVRAFDYKPVPYDRSNVAGIIPDPTYDTLTIYSAVTRSSIDMPIDRLPDLIYVLTELQRRLNTTGR